MKDIIKNIKQEIKEKESAQRLTKSQRKTKNFAGERTMSPSDATYKAQQNSKELSIMYVAYHILKHGLEEPVVEDVVISQYGYTRKMCTNLPAVRDAIVRCCGEKCRLLDDLDVHFYNIDISIWEKIQEWKKKYAPKGEQHEHD